MVRVMRQNIILAPPPLVLYSVSFPSQIIKEQKSLFLFLFILNMKKTLVKFYRKDDARKHNDDVDDAFLIYSLPNNLW